MKKLLVITAAVDFLNSISSFVLFAEGSKEEADIAAINEIWDQWTLGVNTGDSDLWISLWDDNGIKMPPDAPVIIGKEKIGAGRRKGAEEFDAKMEINPEEIRIAGDFAFSRGTFTLSLTPKAGGGTIFMDGKFLTIFKRQADGSWKIFRDCYNSNVPPK